jgi:hypothetical protein
MPIRMSSMLPPFRAVGGRRGQSEGLMTGDRSPGGAVGSSFVPPPPWRMAGEAIVSFASLRSGAGAGARAIVRSSLPRGVRPLPGPAVVVGVRYDSSPVGPFVELSVGVPARLGLRPGLCVVFQVVSAPSARASYRSSWGLPASVEPTLEWTSLAGRVTTLRCEALDFSLTGEAVGPGVPMVLPLRSVQRRADGPVVLGRRMLARVRRARTAIEVADGGVGPGAGAGAGAEAAWSDERAFLARFAGAHPGLHLAGARILARPARQPAGLWSSLRAPLVAP